MSEITLDRLKQMFAATVRALVANRIDFLALYPCKVVAQNGDGTLELQPDDARLPGLSHVRLRLGLPGASVTVPAGDRILLGFDNGDPQKPYAALWDGGGSCTQLNLNATTIVLNGGTFPVARATQDTAGPYPIRGGNTTVKA